MSATGRSDVRRADDFYSTPEWCVDALAKVLDFGPSCLDPCAGTGAIMRAVEKYGARAMGIELDHGRAALAHAQPGDALSDAPWPHTHTVVTNPPYSLAMNFVLRALRQEPPGGVAMLLRLNWLASRKRAEFHRLCPSDVYILPRRPSFSEDGKTDATEYAWFVWRLPGAGGHWRVLECP